MIGKLLLAAGLVTLASTATFSQAMPGSPQEQAACRPDTRRFCTHIKPEMGPFAYLGMPAKQPRQTEQGLPAGACKPWPVGSAPITAH